MVDVLVVGGGPVGMVTALGLARAGVSVRLIEAQPSLNESPRAAVYHWSVLDGLARIGLIEDLESIALKSDKYTYIVRNSGERISFSMRALRNHTARPYNLHLGQHRLVEVVLRRLRRGRTRPWVSIGRWSAWFKIRRGLRPTARARAAPRKYEPSGLSAPTGQVVPFENC